MSIVIGADAAGLRLKEVVKDFLEKENFHVVDVTAEGQDFVDDSCCCCRSKQRRTKPWYCD